MRWTGLFLLTLCLLCLASSLDITIGDLSGGGMVGNVLSTNSALYLSPPGSALVWTFVFLCGLQLSCGFSWLNLYARTKDWFVKHRQKERQPVVEKPASGAPPKNDLGQRLHKALLLLAGQVAPARLKAVFRLRRNIQLPPIDLGLVREPAVTRTVTPASPPSSSPPLTPEPVDQVPAEPEIPPAPRPALETDPDLRTLPELPLEPECADPDDEETCPPELSCTAPIDDSTPSFEEVSDQPSTRANFVLPSTDLLTRPQAKVSTSQEALEEKGNALVTCFNDFGIKGDLVRITPGPVVTLYAFKPAPGVRVNRISNLSNDLSLALKAFAIRIQAPIPGSDTVGIEIPNDVREIVSFRELVESPDFSRSSGPLTIILGKDIAGRPAVDDITRMPHLLIGGTTGAGKSVSLNVMLLSLLYRRTPDELKLLLIDPKQVEMSAYADMPHLVHPVVTDMNDARAALEWATQDMDNRFTAFSRIGTKHLAAYNERLAQMGDSRPSGLEDLTPLPYLVIVIDELADLMATAAREVEGSIQRLLAKARAAGIHLILATQRPSVNVVTGLLKANLSCRISFQVISRFDSRTILDQSGAEYLLGKGDMLYMPTGSRLTRLHAPFVSDEEIHAVTSWWKSQQKPTFAVDFSKMSSEAAGQSGAMQGGDADSDPLYEEARAFVVERGQASISLLQRRFRIGFNRAARLTEQFEKEGLVTPGDGRGPRVVIQK